MRNKNDWSISDNVDTLQADNSKLNSITSRRSMHIYGSQAAKKPRHSSQIEEWPDFGAGKSFPQSLPELEDYVDFDGSNDPLNAQNWPMNKKYYNLAFLSHSI